MNLKFEKPRQIKVYSHHNIDELTWPDTPHGNYAKNFLMPLINDGVSKYISNVNRPKKITPWT